MTGAITGKSSLNFFLLVFILSVPFWLAGTIAERFFPKEIPINLPFGALMFVCPLIAAGILTHRESGAQGLKLLLMRTFDFNRIKNRLWLAPVFLIMPVTMLLVYGLKKLSGTPVAALQMPGWIAPVSFLLFFIGAIFEELGWQGYVFEPLETRYGALGASLLIGGVWASWHIVPYFQAHNAPAWVLWQCLFTVATRVMMVWIYNNTGKSAFTAIAYHAMLNVSTLVLTQYGLVHEPFLAFVIIAVAALLITLLWGPKTLAQYKFSR